MKSFVDEMKVKLKAGKGGNGTVSFRRAAHIPKGGPDGGDGGRGASIHFEADENLHSLLDFRYKREFEAESGHNGSGQQKQGRSGRDLRLRVPVGTRIYSEDGEVEADLLKHGQSYQAARGGSGGHGNTHFKSSTNQAPRIATPGEQGEERDLFLEIRSLCDVGIIGFPNAGKSSLLRALTSARPTVGDYPFTTLHPQLGRTSKEPAITLADIPGLIPGAHENRGLGHRFLRHISRAEVLLWLLFPSPDDSLVEMYEQLEKELGAFDSQLLNKQRLVVVNKSDLFPSDHFEQWEQLQQRCLHPMLISAKHHKGLKELQLAIEEKLFEHHRAMLS